MDPLTKLWESQKAQQNELGLDPALMTDVERARCASDFIQLMHEEAAELGRLTPTYKRHLLDIPKPSRADVADSVADVLKTLLALAQVHGLELDDVVGGFERKTLVVKHRAESERLRLRHDTKLICCDLDDVICDLSEWREVIEANGGQDAPGELSRRESLKDTFYKGGRFRSMPTIPGASDALRAIRKAGYKIIVVTARPQWQYKQLHADTLYWLGENNIPHDLVLFDRNKVEAIYRHVVPAWPVAFIEDMSRNARDLAEVGIKVLLFDQPHNQDTAGKNIHRVLGWSGVLDHLQLSNQ